MKANGPAIRAFRKKSSIGLRELARDIETSCGFMSRLETGQRDASMPTLERIAVRLDVPVAAITLAESRERVS